MKPALALLLLAAAPVQAADCKLSRSENEERVGGMDVAEAILAEARMSRQDNAALGTDPVALQSRHWDFPGEPHNRSGWANPAICICDSRAPD